MCFRVVPMIFRVVIALLMVAAPVSAGQQPSSKADWALQKALATTATSHRVIISGDAACLAGIRAGLLAHGDVVTDLQSASVVTGLIHRQDVLIVDRLVGLLRRAFAPVSCSVSTV